MGLYILPEENAPIAAQKRLVCLKQKEWSKRGVPTTSTKCPDHLSRQFRTTASTFLYSSKNSSAEHIHAFLYIFLCAWVWVRLCVCVRVCVCVCVCVSVCCLSMWVSLFVMEGHVDKARICSAEEWVCLSACLSVCGCGWMCLWMCAPARARARVCVCVCVYARARVFFL